MVVAGLVKNQHQAESEVELSRREINYAKYGHFEYTLWIGGDTMKRIVFFFMFCLITFFLAEWAAANEIVGRIKELLNENNDTG